MHRTPEPPDPFDPFTLMGLDRQFDLDEAALRANYEALSHHERATPEMLTRFDHAREILLDPVKRGRHLLALLGGASEPDTDAPPPDPHQSPGSPGAGDSAAQGRGLEMEQSALFDQLNRLFAALHGPDPADVQRQRRQTLRSLLNALEALQKR